MVRQIYNIKIFTSKTFNEILVSLSSALFWRDFLNSEKHIWSYPERWQGFQSIVSAQEYQVPRVAHQRCHVHLEQKIMSSRSIISIYMLHYSHPRSWGRLSQVCLCWGEVVHSPVGKVLIFFVLWDDMCLCGWVVCVDAREYSLIL